MESSPEAKNISVYQNENQVHIFAIPSHSEGVGRRHGRWTGCGGRRCCGDVTRQRRTAKTRGPGARCWRQVPGRPKADQGRRSQSRTRLRGERDISRKAIAQGMSDVLRCPVCSCALCFVQTAHETAGAARIRHSLRPPSGGSSRKTRTLHAARSRTHGPSLS
jgi:hypothetical protein